MALRYLQAFIPANGQDRLAEILGDQPLLGLWKDQAQEDRVAIHLLVPAEESEAIMDRLTQAFSGSDVFRIVVLAAEATVPRLEPEEEQTEEAAPQPGPEAEPSPAERSGRISREELYTAVAGAVGITRVFVVLTVLSALVAGVGLLRDDIAVVIGSMVIAPLLGPNVAMALATTLGDTGLLRRAVQTNAVGALLALAVSGAMGLVVAVDPASPAIAARTQPQLSDLILALAAGTAGALAFTRGLAEAVIGVMVAVALMPPMVSAGMLLGSGHLAQALGALLLVGINVICINLASVLTFLAQGVRPRTWWEERRARRATRRAMALWAALLVLLLTFLYLAQR